MDFPEFSDVAEQQFLRPKALAKLRPHDFEIFAEQERFTSALCQLTAHFYMMAWAVMEGWNATHAERAHMQIATAMRLCANECRSILQMYSLDQLLVLVVDEDARCEFIRYAMARVLQHGTPGDDDPGYSAAIDRFLEYSPGSCGVSDTPEEDVEAEYFAEEAEEDDEPDDVSM